MKQMEIIEVPENELKPSDLEDVLIVLKFCNDEDELAYDSYFLKRAA